MDETKDSLDIPVSSSGKSDEDSSVSCIAATIKGKKKPKQDGSRRKKRSKVKSSLEKEPLRVKVSIQDIPNNVLKMIFSYLDIRQRLRIELVCRKWRLIGKLLPWINPTALIFTPEIRKSSLHIPSNELTDHILLSLLSRCGSCLKELEFTYDPIDYVIITSRSLQMLGKYCPNLEKLKLHGVPVDSGTLKVIASGCRKLKEFCLADVKNRNFGDGVLSITQLCESLECLEVSDVFLSDEWFEEVNAKLKKIDLVICALSPPTPLQNLTSNCDSLEDLRLSFDCDLAVDDVKELFKIFNHFKRTLKRLCIYDGGLPKFVNWCEGVKNLHHLVELSLLYSQSVDDKLMACLVKECPNIESLTIPGCGITDRGAAILEALPLKTLDIGCNGNITDSGLGFLCRKGELVKCSISLVPSITEDFCCSLARSCPNLRELDVSANGEKIGNRLINAFRLAIQRQFLHIPVKLVVGCTGVTLRVKRCAGLEIKFTSDYEEGYLKFKRRKTFSMKI